MAKPNFTGIDIEGIRQLQDVLARGPGAVRDRVVPKVAETLINILRNYPPKRRVTRKEAYPNAPAGPGWFSEKQRRYVMRAIGSGEIKVPYQRTQTFAKGWRTIGEGSNTIVVNEVGYAADLVDDQYQSRMAKLIGWEKLSSTIAKHDARLEKVANGEAQRAIKDLDRNSG